jgi:UDP-N-acetylglucosamine 2-epimerase (non-hydrolysing)
VPRECWAWEDRRALTYTQVPMAVKVLLIAGARPNFIKIAPLMRALGKDPLFQVRLVHTGQHYDDRLSKIFFDDLKIPRPDLELGVGSGTHAAQTAEIIKRFEPILQSEQPQAVLVVGDVNSTIACAIVVAKFQLERPFRWRSGERRRPVIIHVEAGLRSFDEDMPEEINRKLTDAISDVLFVSDPAGLTNLKNEGVPDDKVFFVGNVMIDTLLAAKEQAMKSPVLRDLGLDGKEFGLVTLHRPSNVDDPAALKTLLGVLDQVAAKLPMVFPVHPRTRQRMAANGVTLAPGRWTVTDPIGYLEFMKLQAAARVVFTDSGGVQEETTVLGVPCVTLRENTERPVTISEGTNTLAGTAKDAILAAAKAALAGPLGGTARQPRYWDGKAAERINGVLAELFKT